MASDSKERRTGLGAGAAGLLRPTAGRPDREPEPEREPAVPSGQGGEPEPGAVEATPEPKNGAGRSSRRNKVAVKAEAGGVSGRKLYLPEDIHFRLRMLAYQRGQKLSETAAEVLDKALPKWNVERTG